MIETIEQRNNTTKSLYPLHRSRSHWRCAVSQQTKLQLRFCPQNQKFGPSAAGVLPCKCLLWAVMEAAVMGCRKGKTRCCTLPKCQQCHRASCLTPCSSLCAHTHSFWLWCARHTVSGELFSRMASPHIIDWSTRWSEEGRLKRMPLLQSKLGEGSLHWGPKVSLQQLSHLMLRLFPAAHTGIVSKFTGAQGVIGMHGGLPPPDAFPFATLGGDLLTPDAPPSSSSSPQAPAGPSATGAQPTGGQLQRLDITEPSLVALAQQYIMTPKVCRCGVWVGERGRQP
jgi:hypothetical protein